MLILVCEVNRDKHGGRCSHYTKDAEGIEAADHTSQPLQSNLELGLS